MMIVIIIWCTIWPSWFENIHMTWIVGPLAQLRIQFDVERTLHGMDFRKGPILLGRYKNSKLIERDLLSIIKERK